MSRFLKILLCLCGLPAGMQVAQSQPYYFRHYQVENGLSNNTVYSIAQDSKGFMWFATKDGLNRFDGLQFKIFHTIYNQPGHSLQDNYLQDVCADDDGGVWVAARRGLYHFNPRYERLEAVTDTIADVLYLHKGRDNRLWFLSGQKVYWYQQKTGQVKRVTGDNDFKATAICSDNGGRIWISTTHGYLQQYDEANERFIAYDVFAHSPQPTSKWIQNIKRGDGNSIFVGTTSQGLKRFDINTLTYTDVITSNPDKTSIFVRDILKYSDNEYWIATESGIFIYDIGTKKIIHLKKKYSDPYSLNDNAVYNLYKDAENGIWAGTFFGGVNYYAKQNAAFIKYFPDNTQFSISGNAVRSICEDDFGHLWVGTEDGGLNRITKKTGEIQRFMPTGKKGSIAYSNIHGLLADGKNLWIGTFENGIDVMDIATGVVKKHFISGPGKHQLKSNFALAFLKTPDGKLLVGTSNGLYYYNPANDGFDPPAEVPGDHFVSSLITDHDNIIWVATMGHGVFWFDPATGRNGHLLNDSNNSNSLSNNNINDLYEDHNHNIWFATEGSGACRLSADRKTFTSFTTVNKLPGNFVFSIQEDDANTIWMSTSKGLASFKDGKGDAVVYTTANGLVNDQFNYHSGYKDASGRLYFGSVRGMVSFRPENFTASTTAPPVYITGFQVYNKDVAVDSSGILHQSIITTDKIVLPHDMSSISIDFAALSYISPSKIEYRYKLQGLDKNWISIPTNRKVYFNLTPGTYTFTVSAAISGTISPNTAVLTIQVLPPFWATTTAYIVYVLAAAVLLYFIVSTYHRRHQNKKEKEIYESKIEFFTNVAHEIKTPLTLIKGPVENLMERESELPGISEDLACLDRNTNRLMALITQILDFRQTEIMGFSLDLVKVNIKEAINETFLSFNILARKKHLHFNLHLPDDDVYAYVDREAMQKIFSNLVSNAVKYASTVVDVTLRAPDPAKNEVCLIFQNDGHIISRQMEDKIFEPFFRLEQTKAQKGTGIGLTLAKSLTELHGGKLFIDFENRYRNTFILCIPLKTDVTNIQHVYPNKHITLSN